MAKKLVRYPVRKVAKAIEQFEFYNNRCHKITGAGIAVRDAEEKDLNLITKDSTVTANILLYITDGICNTTEEYPNQEYKIKDLLKGGWLK